MIRRILAGLIWFACAIAPARANLDVHFESPVLTAFAGHPVTMRAEVIEPDRDAHEPTRTYPALYVVHAFGASYHTTFREDRHWRAACRDAGLNGAIVFLDASQPHGHNEFVDSPTNGPWQTALTTEFIPYLEARLHLTPEAGSRFLVGHSSGGWSALWLQLTRPEFFGGAWAIAPDPLDFHDFTGIDLTASPPQNFYRNARGERGFVRRAGRDTSTLREYVDAQRRRGLGGQFDSFEAVFSPLRPDGLPAPLFDRRSGEIDPAVARYWEAHFDLTRLLRERWPVAGPALRGKLHIFVGSQDTFHLESSVARFARAAFDLDMDAAHVTLVEGADHFTIFETDGDLIARIVREVAASSPP